jgi:hypothetical protein
LSPSVPRDPPDPDGAWHGIRRWFHLSPDSAAVASATFWSVTDEALSAGPEGAL